ncbi:hypothetical protein [Sutcliffiella rhizosphaerae]|uniref:hypothetical protein n=1 Tax=Sutcliffiella rhizosphaerae TaxID=2880967 RepID=UPI001E540D8C|nr:hypothetical protein [Sutcliffiella rhizosphaerae]
MIKILEKIIYFFFTICFFVVLWKITGRLWNSFVPWNSATDLIGIFFVAPILIGLAFLLTSLSFNVIKQVK